MSGLEFAYAVLPAAVAAESAGVPLPGEATLITAAILAAHGHLEIAPVIALAAAGAITGDNLGYLLGRRLGRPALLAGGPARRLRRGALRGAASLFARYGGAAVLIRRFVSVGRIGIAWLAGADEMPWRRFATWNAAGSVAWAVLVGGLAYALGAAGATGSRWSEPSRRSWGWHTCGGHRAATGGTPLMRRSWRAGKLGP